MEIAVSNADVKKILKDELDDLRLRIIANHIAAGQVASGRTKESLKVEATEEEGILWGRYPFATLERGRKPGRTPNNFASIIKKWIIDKGISVSPIPYKRRPSEKWQPKYTPDERGIMSLAGAIAHKIKTSGTRLHRDGGRNDIYSNEMENTVESISSKISSMFSLKIDSIELNNK